MAVTKFVIAVAALLAVGLVSADDFNDTYQKILDKSSCVPANETVKERRKNELETCIFDVLGLKSTDENFLKSIKEAHDNSTKLAAVVKCIATKRGVIDADCSINPDKAEESINLTSFATAELKEEVMKARQDCFFSKSDNCEQMCICVYEATMKACLPHSKNGVGGLLESETAEDVAAAGMA